MDTLKLLVEAEADVNSTCGGKHGAVIPYMQYALSDLSQELTEGSGWYLVVSSELRMGFLRTLASAGADINGRLAWLNGMTALMVASRHWLVGAEEVELYIELGADATLYDDRSDYAYGMTKDRQKRKLLMRAGPRPYRRMMRQLYSRD